MQKWPSHQERCTYEPSIISLSSLLLFTPVLRSLIIFLPNWILTNKMNRLTLHLWMMMSASHGIAYKVWINLRFIGSKCIEKSPYMTFEVWKTLLPSIPVIALFDFPVNIFFMELVNLLNLRKEIDRLLFV